MAPEIYAIVRWLHVISGSAWLGEVMVINFVLIPVLSKYQGAARKEFMTTIFPGLFRLASVLAATTALTGGILLYSFIGWEFGQLTERGSWGWSILIGGSLGLILTLFHFFIESWLSKRLEKSKADSGHDFADDVHIKLKIIPRIGMLVIALIFMLMLNATHQLFGF